MERQIFSGGICTEYLMCQSKMLLLVASEALHEVPYQNLCLTIDTFCTPGVTLSLQVGKQTCVAAETYIIVFYHNIIFNS